MDRRVMHGGLAAGGLVGLATSLLLTWPSANAALIAAGLFVAALLTGVWFLSRALVGEAAPPQTSALERYARDPQS